jgi:hypothetical protein
MVSVNRGSPAPRIKHHFCNCDERERESLISINNILTQFILLTILISFFYLIHFLIFPNPVSLFCDIGY